MSNNIHFDRPHGRSLLAPTLFGALSQSLRDVLLTQAPLRTFADGQLIQQRGQSSDGFWVIDAGSVQVGQFLESGEFRAVAQLAEGDSYGELAVLAANRRAVDSIAKGEARLYWIDAAIFRAEIAKDPDSMGQLVTTLALECQELIGVIASGRAIGSMARIAALLANLLGPDRDKGSVTIGQQELGDLLGLTRVTVNKGLAALQEDGLIERGYGSITVHDAGSLRRLSLS